MALSLLEGVAAGRHDESKMEKKKNEFHQSDVSSTETDPGPGDRVITEA